MGISAKVLIYLLGGVAFIGSYAAVGFFGYSRGSAQSKTEIAQYQADKVIADKNLQDQVSKTNDAVVIKYVDRDKVITQYKTVYLAATDNLPKTPNLPNGWVNLHDATVNESLIKTLDIADNTDSGVSPGKALKSVISNYATCDKIRNQLIELQDSINHQTKIISKVN